MAVQTVDSSPRTVPGTTGFVTSRDGTIIGYRQVGHGSGIVVLHGAMESSQSHMQLAEALASRFTVYLPDRRGRGLSGPYSASYSPQHDVEDLDALLTQTGAHYVFGVSSGAIITLQAALTLPAVQRAALYEPPLFREQSEPMAILTRFDRELAQGNVPAAMVTGMKGAQMGPAIFNLMPRWLLESLTRLGMSAEEKKAGPDDITMRMLAPTLHYDFQLVTDMSGQLHRYSAVPVDVLLLGGSKSPAYLKAALDVLEKVLPHATRVQLPGLGHGGSGNTNRGGHPERVAQELRLFFA